MKQILDNMELGAEVFAILCFLLVAVIVAPFWLIPKNIYIKLKGGCID